jgi:hypothetical protein
VGAMGMKVTMLKVLVFSYFINLFFLIENQVQLPDLERSNVYMHKLVSEARHFDRKRDKNQLGTRYVESPESNSGSITTKLKDYLKFDFLPNFDSYTEPDFDIANEANKRYNKVLNLAGEYIVDFVLQNGPAPPTWKQVPDHAIHEFVFERVIFHINRDVQVPEEIPDDPYTKLNDHLISLHFFEGHWGARGILQQALENRRPRKEKGKKKGKTNIIIIAITTTRTK